MPRSGLQASPTPDRLRLEEATETQLIKRMEESVLNVPTTGGGRSRGRDFTRGRGGETVRSISRFCGRGTKQRVKIHRRISKALR